MIFNKYFRIFKVLNYNRVYHRFKCSYTFGHSNERLSPLTIGQLIEKRSEDSSHTIACVSMHQNIIKTYEQLNHDV